MEYFSSRPDDVKAKLQINLDNLSARAEKIVLVQLNLPTTTYLRDCR